MTTPTQNTIFKMLKYCPQWPVKGFSELNKAGRWVDQFMAWYNQDHQHSGIRYLIPSQRHQGQDALILKRENN